MRLKDLIAKAKAANACPCALRAMKRCGTLAKARKHKQAAEWALWYADAVIQGPWPEGEALIAKDAQSAYDYADYIIGGRWPKGEAAIKNDSWPAYCYARYIIGGRWKEGEAAINSDEHAARSYAQFVYPGSK